MKCPVDHAEARLVRHSFAEVAEAFVGFTSNRDLDEYKPRGGNVRVTKKPRANRPSGLPLERLPRYGVESTFNKQQFAYVAVSIAALNKLLRGEVMQPHVAAPKPFAQGVIADFMEQDRGNLSFGRALSRNALRLYDDFGMAYPNLLPALKAMSRTGGAEGTAIAVAASREMLCVAISGADPLEDAAYLDRGASAYRFTLAHPYCIDEKTHEVWCPGEAVGKRIIREAGKAAVTLAGMPVSESYKSGVLDPLDETQYRLSDQIEARILEMYTAAL
jgi:hypothetical protein